MAIQSADVVDKTSGATGTKVDAAAYNALRDDGIGPVNLVVGATHETLAAAVSASGAGNVIWVKPGSYAGATITTPTGLTLLLAPGVIFTSHVNISAAQTTIIALGQGTEFQAGLTITGDQSSVVSHSWDNKLIATSSNEGVDISGQSRCVGWKVEGHSGADGGNNAAAVRDRSALEDCWIEGADAHAVKLASGNANAIRGCKITGTIDEAGISITAGSGHSVTGNRVDGAGTDGIEISVDDNIVSGNIVPNSTVNGIDLTGNDNVVVGNIFEAGSGSAIADTGTGNDTSGNRSV